MPTVDAVWQKLDKAKVFTALNANDGFYQVLKEKEKLLAHYVLDPIW